MPNPKTLIDNSDMRYMTIGLIAGFGVVLMSIIFNFLLCTIPFYLTLCIGLGLVAGALGTTATVKFKGHIMTGSGAVGALFFFLMQHANFEKVTFGMIEGPFTVKTQIIVQDETEILGALRGSSSTNQRTYYFVIKGEKLVSSQLRIELDNNRTFTIDQNYINPLLAHDKVIDWKVDTVKNVIINLRSKDTIGFLTMTENLPLQKSVLSQYVKAFFDAVIPSCFGQASIEPDVHQLIGNLNADNLRVSRESIDALSSKGSIVVSPLMSAYNDNSASEQLRVNVIKVLAILNQKNRNAIDSIDEKTIRAILLSARKNAGIISVYSQMLIDTLSVSGSPIIKSKIAKVINQPKNEVILQNSDWKICNFVGNIWYFHLETNNTVRYGKSSDKINSSREKWSWKLEDSLLTIGWNKETFKINIRSQQNTRFSALANRKGPSHDTWAEKLN